MKGQTLIPCDACARHVRSDEQTCPFCAAARLSAPVSRARALPRGTSRAAAFALRAALLTATACSASHDADDDSDTPGEAGALQALDAGVTHDAGNKHDAQVAADARVADAGRDAAPEASVSDAALHNLDEDDAFVPIPIYGGVFPDPRTRAKV